MARDKHFSAQIPATGFFEEPPSDNSSSPSPSSTRAPSPPAGEPSSSSTAGADTSADSMGHGAGGGEVEPSSSQLGARAEGDASGTASAATPEARSAAEGGAEATSGRGGKRAGDGGGGGSLLISDSERANSMRARMESGEVVCSTENVAVHPSAAAAQRIRGRLRLVKHDSAVYLSWLPYTSAELASGLDPKAKGQQYAIRAVSLSEIRSIRRQTPTLGWQYVIIVLNTGLAFPPLYFYDGGVRAFIAAVKQHATLIKSQDDPNVYLVNDSEDPLMLHRSMGTLRWQSPASSPTSDKRVLEGADASTWQQETGAAPPAATFPTSPTTDVPIKVLQGFAGLTRFARIALGVSNGVGRGERVLGGPDAAERMPVRLPIGEQPSLTPTATSPPAMASSELGQFELVDPLEEVLAATRGPKQEVGPPLSHEEWVSFLDEEGRVRDKGAVCAQVFRRGIDPDLRREVWKFLLGFYSFESTYAERRQLDEEKRKEYFVYKHQWESVTEVQAKRFAKYRERVSRIEKDVVRTDRRLPQFEDDDSPSVALLRSILLTYSFYNFDLGYCQGMSDLLSPFLVVMEDESEAFWCFAQFMETLGRNFNRDQTGMQSQLLALSKLLRVVDEPLSRYLETIDAANLFCCFRWLLILFKREFEFEDVLSLWERLWTCPMTKSFHLYICCAILKRFRRKIFDEQMQFDALLRFVNELSCHVDLDDTLQYAEALCLWAGKRGEACIPQPVEEEIVLIEGPETGDV